MGSTRYLLICFIIKSKICIQPNSIINTFLKMTVNNFKYLLINLGMYINNNYYLPKYLFILY